MNAALVTIGDELLNGQTVDTNAAWLGLELNKIGITVVLKMSIGDNREDILEGIRFAFTKASILLLTGGLGPTKDDITKKTLAEYFDCQLVFDSEMYGQICQYFRKTGRTPTEAHKQQSYMPAGAKKLINNRGTAPGMWFSGAGKYLLSMPGIPTEMKGIMEDSGLATLAALNTNQHIQHFIIQTAGVGESYIAEHIQDILDELPQELSFAYLPGIGSVKLRLTAKGSNPEFLMSNLDDFGHRLSLRLGNAVVGIGGESLEEVIGKLAKRNRLYIGTAESCTGGHVAQLITSISGSSNYFKGSIVAYANEIKMNSLNVPSDILEKEGAVSEATVKAMTLGVIDRLNVDVGVAVSGIAGPGGGTPDKPVGTIWMAVGNKKTIRTQKLQLVKNRDLNIKYTAVAALNLLRLFLLDIDLKDEHE